MLHKKTIIVFLVLLLLLAGCGTKSKTTTGSDIDSTTADDTNGQTSVMIDINKNVEESTSNDPTEEDSIDEPVQVEEEEIAAIPAYYVNEKYYIKPMDKEENAKVVLLTFDDSPAGDSTVDILDTLDKYEAKAIWFINGYYADRNRELLQEIHDRGHIIGNHTWWHENLSKIDAETTRTEIVSINDLVEEVIGIRPVYFRAPYGVYTDLAKEILKEENMQYMNWTWGSLDWELKSSEEIEKNVIGHVHNGANILFHDKRITADALENILHSLSEEGYSFVLPTEVNVQN